MREIKFRATIPSPENESEAREYHVQTLEPTYKMHGYVYRKVTEHPQATDRGYVLEHRLVIEENLGQILPVGAVIHHKNQIRDDNRLENLEYMDEQSKHAKHHDKGSRNPNGQFVATDPKFTEKKFRLFNKNTRLIQVMTLAKLIATTFRTSQFEYRGEWTGLKDKNGVEIYEGDIVRIPYIDPMGGINYEDKNDPEYLGKVIYERGSFMVKQNYKPEPIVFDRYFVKKQGEYVSNYGNLTVYENSPIFEVIGNIYENPELLK